jgi:hypothetical protein
VRRVRAGFHSIQQEKEIPFTRGLVNDPADLRCVVYLNVDCPAMDGYLVQSGAE